MSAGKDVRAMIKQVMCVGLAWLGLAVGASAQTTIVEYVHTDALGSPVAVTDASGALIPSQSQVYEPYGAPITHGPTDGPGFTGHVEDSATGLTYMQQRYYDPAIGRFLSSDPVTPYQLGGKRIDRYAYSNNNPFSFKDSDGRSVCFPSDNQCEERKRENERKGIPTFSAGEQKPAEKNRIPAGLKSAWQGIVAHRAIQADIATLGTVEVKAEVRTINPFSSKFGYVDLMMRPAGNDVWSVFEIKPASHMNDRMTLKAESQLKRYVDSLNAGKDQPVAKVGVWSEYFGGDQSRATQGLPKEFGGIIFGGVYVYGPGEDGGKNGVIFYSAFDGPTVVP